MLAMWTFVLPKANKHQANRKTFNMQWLFEQNECAVIKPEKGTTHSDGEAWGRPHGRKGPGLKEKVKL